MQDTKRCSRCGETKPTHDWPPGKKWADGLYPYCRTCKRAVGREYRERHAERLSAAAKERYAANPEPAKSRRRARYYADPSRAVAEANRWNRENPDRRREIKRKYDQANLAGTVRESVRRRYATRKGAPAIHFTPDQLAQRAAYFGHKCWMCGDPMTEWDHVKPLSRGGWHCLSNLRPACRSCNARKGDCWNQ